LPDATDGGYRILVVADAGREVYEIDREDNNAGSSAFTLTHPDLVVSNVQAPAAIVSGSMIQVRWNVRNAGTGPALGNWTDTLYLSTGETLNADAIKLA
ncbi:CARDB domain-containing protein, partial [Rhizobium ruizarguesonis]